MIQTRAAGIALTLLLITQNSWSQESPGALWKHVPVPGVEKAWSNIQKPGHMITYVRNENPRGLSLSGASKTQVLSGVLGFRQLAYQQLGFQQFKVSSFHYEPGPQPILELYGSYQRPDGAYVQFFEIQKFSEKRFEQYAYFAEELKPLPEAREIRNLIKRLMSPSRFPSSEETDQVKTQAFYDPDCADCLLRSTLPTPKLLEELKELSAVSDQCAVDSWLFDPSKKSILQEINPESKPQNKAQVVARSFLTCVYGTLSGSYKSIRDIVMAIPNILGMTWQGLKSAGSATVNFEYRKWLEGLSVQKIKDVAGTAVTVTKDTVADSYQKASMALFNGFQEGGITGSVASVAHAAWNSSPHQAVGQFLSRLGSEIYSALSKEWTALGCMPAEAMSEAMCQVGGYLITDLIAGKLALSGLSKAPRMKDAISAVRTKMEKVPIAGALLTKNLKATNFADCGKIQEEKWKIDSGIKLQGTDLNVAQAGEKILALGMSPKTMKLECFEVVGSWATQISERIKATESRAQHSGGKTGADFFSSGNSSFARSDEEFIEGINRKIESGISKKQTRLVATALKNHPEQMERYGDLLRSVDDMKRRLTLPGLADLEIDSLKKTIFASEQTIKTLNETLPLLSRADQLNLNSISAALKAASVTQKPEEILLMNQALGELGRSIKRNSGNLDEAFEGWSQILKKDRKHLTDNDLLDVKACLINSGKK